MTSLLQTLDLNFKNTSDLETETQALFREVDARLESDCNIRKNLTIESTINNITIPQMNILICDKEFFISELNKSKLKSLRCHIVKNFGEQVTHLVTSRITLNNNFINSLGSAKFLVSTAWIEECVKKNKVVKEEGFFPKTPKIQIYENKYKFKLKNSFERAKKKKIFNGYKILNVSYSRNLSGIKTTFKLYGGKIKNVQNIDKVINCPEEEKKKLFVVSNKKTLLFDQYINKGFIACHHQAIPMFVLKQEISKTIIKKINAVYF